MSTPPSSSIRFPGAELEIDLDALVRNYLHLKEVAAPATCGATVKADAYGLGLERVAPSLWDAGCRTFFVAMPQEGVELRSILPDAEIMVFNGAPRGTERYFEERRLIPVLNSLEAVRDWAAFARDMGTIPCPAALHFDTGMNRLGLSGAEVEELIDTPLPLPFPVPAIMSHLASADTPDAEMNTMQRELFAERAARFLEAHPEAAGTRLSLANSAGVLTDPGFHFDLVRPGIGLYGANPFVDRDNPMDNVVRLKGRVLQIRDIGPGETVGYGGDYVVNGPTRIATVDVGYGDGLLRAFGQGRMAAVVNGHSAPIVGRVSMDSHALDITALPDDACAVGSMVDLLGGPVDMDAAIKATGLSGYELLTLLGRRYNRVYKSAGS